MVKEVLHLKNVLWSKKDGFFLESEVEDADLYLNKYTLASDTTSAWQFRPVAQKTIDNPVIIMDTLHSCFVHAIIDGIFSAYMLKKQIIEEERCLDNFALFVRKEDILEYPEQNLKNIDKESSVYSGVYGEMMKVVTKESIYFEHLLDDSEVFLFKDVYVTKLKKENHRSLWNSSLYYPGRYEGDVIFSDDELQRMLNLFLVDVLNSYGLEKKEREFKKNIIIVDRKTDYRSFRKTWLHATEELDENEDNTLLDSLDNILIEQPCLYYKGVVYLEDMSLKEQMECFQNNDIIITPHGANMVHSLWTSNKIIVEVIYDDSTLPMYKRVCSFTNNKLAQMTPYNIEQFVIMLCKRFKPLEPEVEVTEI